MIGEAASYMLQAVGRWSELAIYLSVSIVDSNF